MSMTAAAARATIAAMGARDVEFEAYVAARRRGLLRTAYLLTGDQHSAEDLLQSALAKLYLSWDKVQRREALDGYVRRIMVNEHISWWRRAWRRNSTAPATCRRPGTTIPDTPPTPWQATRCGRSSSPSRRGSALRSCFGSTRT
jgi:DNA-directed RNA polymerase specialized sigma24 family protein